MRFSGPFVGHRPQLPGNEIIFQNPMGESNYDTLDLVPASLRLDDTEIELNGITPRQCHTIGMEQAYLDLSLARFC